MDLRREGAGEERSGEICQRRREKNEGERCPEGGDEIDKEGEERQPVMMRQAKEWRRDSTEREV